MKKELYLYNTATMRKEKFAPLREQAGMYCCGPTVYNYAHIGNLRTYIFEDVLKRTLIACGYDVKHVVNITDVGHLVSDADTGEDKMETGAAREGKSVWDIAEFYTKKFMADISSLNILQPDVWPKATDYIAQMIDIVKSLEEKGFTYTTGDGIYFDTAKFPQYCDFARIDPETLRAGERVDMGDKRNVTDFALWKFSPKDAKRQMEWDSPWGVGFPGWHIECSAMSLAHLPQPLDIHCGGMDHIRVHHTNEIAQTEAATGEKFANFWLHGEFLVLDKGKMAKSGGNFVTLDTLRDKGVSPLGYRMFCYTAHYRSPLTFSFEGAASAEHGLLNLRKIVSSLNKSGGTAVNAGNVNQPLKSFTDALCDDLNMPRAMAAVWEGLRSDKLTDGEKLAFVTEADKVLGLDLFAPAGNNRTEITEESEGYRIFLSINGELSPSLKAAIVSKAVLRKKSRAAKDFKTADLIRGQFAAAGIAVKDLPGGVTECVVDDPGRAEGAL
ncbi:MAG: cysteine--tRNA ligase [Chitinispirillia bacterium]|nr:cysteine--tRNA ligase [Chitinispirillia bacterium]MCL2241615.1 cysteine--tRNA ligase [Chitinispirillia bacterium]